MNETTIDLIRHGEPEGGRCYRGNGIDDPLSEKGWEQMWAAVGDHYPWQQIITSPLLRCRIFAEALADIIALSPHIDDRLQEVGFGEWEGRRPEDIRAGNPAEYAAFYADPVSNRPPGAEPLDGFFSRVSTAYNNVITNYAGQHVLVVAHAGVIRAVMASVLHISPAIAYRIQVSNAGITRFSHTESGARLEFHNRISL